ncbi:MAG: hypothetical protein Q9165_000275 [Trypethelium subeluteriae]
MAHSTPPPDLGSEERLAELGANWSIDSNDATEIKLWRVSEQDGTAHSEHSFHPSYTYPIFGEEETIFGYKALRVELNFAAHDMGLQLNVRYSKKFSPVGDIEAFDINKAMEPFVPPDAFRPLEGFTTALETDTAAMDFTPPGKIIHSYSVSGDTYQVWCSNLTDPRAQEIARNAQILMPLFIEGATVINLDDADENVLHRWKLYLAYRVFPSGADSLANSAVSKFSLVGYSTSYRLWYLAPNRTPRSIFPRDYSFPPENLSSSITSSLSEKASALTPPSSAAGSPDLHDPMADVDFPVRERISQFLIFPPFRGTSHGTQLYNAMISLFLADPSCLEITVEDPNEAFDDLRDYSDLSRLLNHSATPSHLADPALATDFRNLKIDEKNAKDAVLKLPKNRQDAVPLESLTDMKSWNRIHRASKIHHREFDRLVEMHLLTSIPPSHRSASRIAYKHNAPQAKDREYYFWRCLVKERLRIHNRDSLADLEDGEKEERLNEAVTNVQNDYERILETVRRREEKAATAAIEEGHVGEGKSQADRKRKMARVVLDEDDDDYDNAEGGDVVNGDKHASMVKRTKLDGLDG